MGGEGRGLKYPLGAFRYGDDGKGSTDLRRSGLVRAGQGIGDLFPLIPPPRPVLLRESASRQLPRRLTVLSCDSRPASRILEVPDRETCVSTTFSDCFRSPA